MEQRQLVDVPRHKPRLMCHILIMSECFSMSSGRDKRDKREDGVDNWEQRVVSNRSILET